MYLHAMHARANVNGLMYPGTSRHLEISTYTVAQKDKKPKDTTTEKDMPLRTRSRCAAACTLRTSKPGFTTFVIPLLTDK